MATPVTYTVGKTTAPESRDYSSLSNLEADIGVGISADLVSSDEVWTINVYEDTGSVITESAHSFSPVTDATRNITVTAAAGHSFVDNIDNTNQLIDDIANGVLHEFSGTFAAMIGLACDISFSRLQFRTTGNRGGVFSGAGSDTHNLDQCICHSRHASSRETVLWASTANCDVGRTLIIQHASDRQGIRPGYGTDTLTRLTVVSTNSSSSIGVDYQGGTVELNESAIFGFATATDVTTGDYNASDDTSTPGANSLDSLTFANQFENTAAAGTGDWRLKLGADLILAGTTSGLSEDIVGTTLPSGVSEDIGCWEYVAAAGGGNSWYYYAQIS